MATFVPDPHFFDRVLFSDDMQGAMVEAAQRGIDYAQGISPYVTGDYAGHFEVTPTRFDTRKGAVIENTSDHAAAVEWGQDRHILGQTLAKMEADSHG